MPDPILAFSHKFGASQSNKPVQGRVNLGDGYHFDSRVTDSTREEWSLQANGLTLTEATAIATTLESYAGYQSFQWRPDSSTAYKSFWCTQFDLSEEAPDLWQISLQIQEKR